MSSPNRSDGLLPGDTMLKTLEAHWCVLLLNGLCAIFFGAPTGMQS